MMRVAVSVSEASHRAQSAPPPGIFQRPLSRALRASNRPRHRRRHRHGSRPTSARG